MDSDQKFGIVGGIGRVWGLGNHVVNLDFDLLEGKAIVARSIDPLDKVFIVVL